MGGKGSGGARVGAGRVRTVGSARWVREQRRQRRATAECPDAPTPVNLPPAVVAKPADLPAGQSAVWDQLAPHALAQRTLTPATAWAFRDLCEAIVLKRDMLALIEAEGLTSTSLKTKMDESGGGEQVFEPKAHPLLTRHTALMVRVEAGLARFRLAPMGKELAESVKPVDEWAEFDGPQLIKGASRA